MLVVRYSLPTLARSSSARSGFTTPLGPDGGIDIRIYQNDSGKATSIVKCKAWGARYVGVQPVRELLGVMTHEKIEKAFFMTSGRFSDDAKDVAKGNRITLIDGQMLLIMLQRLLESGYSASVALHLLGMPREKTFQPSCRVFIPRPILQKTLMASHRVARRMVFRYAAHHP